MTNQESIKMIIENFQKSSIAQIELDKKNGRSITQSQSATESESSKDYVGRVVFEFFQNAVDRAYSNIWMELTQNEFIISNDGTPFSIYHGEINGKKSDFYGLNSIHNGTKIAGESIGNKGVGFKSCWNISEHVIIESTKDAKTWGFELFNPTKKENFDDNDDIKKAIDIVGGKVPSFYFPKYFKSKIENFKNNAVTKISIKLKDNSAYKEIKKELEEFKKAKFFFLNQLKDKKDKNFCINIIIDEESHILQSNEYNWNIISLNNKDKISHNELFEERKKVNYKNIPDNPNIAIAFPPEIEENNELYFYTYLPTKVKCGFNILIHADFALDNARVSIPESNYNNKILEIASKLFVDELLTNNNLHNRNDFAKFLIPNNKNDKFAQLVWKELIQDNKLTQILKKVYTKERNFLKSSYEIIFSVIKKWIKEHDYGEIWSDYYNTVYERTIQYFCSEDIYLVYVNDTYKSNLPKKDNDDNSQKSKLFYIDEKNDDRKYKFELLRNLSNITLSSMVELNDPIFINNKIVKENRNIEIYRALAIEMEKNNNLTEFDKLNIVEFLSINANENMNIDYFEYDSKKRDSKAGTQLARIFFPTKTNGWQPAKKCFINIDEEISKNFINFYEIDYSKIETFVSSLLQLKFFGIWDSIPLTEEFNLAWNTIEITKCKSIYFKKVLQNSLLVWEKIKNECNRENEIKKVINLIKEQKIFYDDINEIACKPNEVFLFNDERKRNIINQAYKSDDFKELYNYLQIFTIEDTRDKDKLFGQLLKLKNSGYIIDKTHKTLYKQLILSLSKCTNYKEISSIPLLVNDNYIQNNNLWFADRNTKRYTHYFNGLNFVLFDIETNQEFIKHFGIQFFDPEFELKPEYAKETIQNDLKQKIEDDFLTHMFCLAEEIIHINRFNKEESIIRWNNLRIGYAEDVWLEVNLQNSNYKVPPIGKDIKNLDVLFKPLTDSQRQQNKEKIGDIIHDLIGDPLSISKHSKFYKFGYVIADGVFRDSALGPVLSDYLKTEDKKEFLKEIGIDESDIQEMNNFIKQSILDEEAINIIIGQINSIFEENISNSSNWFLLDTYRKCDKSFKEIEKAFLNLEKYRSVIIQLNPYIHNRTKVLLMKDEIKLKYYISHEKEELTDEEFNCYLENMNEDLHYYNFDKNVILKKFKIKDNVNEYEIEIAKIELDNGINYSSLKIEDNSLPIVNSEQFDKNKKISTIKISEVQRLRNSENQQKRGLAFERIFAIKQAEKLMEDSNLFNKFKFAYAKLGNLKQTVDFSIHTIENIADIIQVSKSTGDGLGYDVLEIENSGVINKVEIKSSIGNTNIHFSNNEIEQIFKMKNDQNWKLYHFVDNKAYDRTMIIKNEIKKLVENKNKLESSIVPESWIISF